MKLNSPAHSTTRLVPLMFEMGRLLKQDLAHGYSMLHVETLRFIDERGEPSMSEVAEYLRASKPTTTALIDGLAKEGLVKRAGDKADRRKTLVCLSLKGKEALAQAGKRRERTLKRFFAPLPRRDQAELARMLSFIISRAS